MIWAPFSEPGGKAPRQADPPARSRSRLWDRPRPEARGRGRAGRFRPPAAPRAVEPRGVPSSASFLALSARALCSGSNASAAV